MPVEIDHVSDFKQFEGRNVGKSDWITVDQTKIQRFAEATLDFAWIHVDPERAAKESPFGRTIAHGYYTLSLIPAMFMDVFRVGDFALALNYGLNKVRFTSPVPVDSRVRLDVELVGVEEIPHGVQLVSSCRVEREGQEKPCCVAETVFRFYDSDPIT